MANVRNPIEFIAPEVWEMIFNQLQFVNKSDLPIEKKFNSDSYCCYNTCVTFCNILDSTKNSWIFSEVVPLILPYLSKRTLLECRKVCKLWKLAVDNFLENMELHLVFRNLKYGHIYPIVYTFHSFSSENKISRFLADMGNHPDNPFPGRGLELHYDPRTNQGLDLNTFWNFVTQFLIRFGQHVLNMRLDMDSLVVEKAESLLALTPNLRNLCLKGSTKDINLANFVKHEGIHKDLFLLRMQASSSSDELSGIFQWHYANCYRNQLQMLQISFAHCNAVLQKLELPKLENLNITVNSIQQLRTIFPVSNPNFKDLSITCTESSSNTNFTLGEVLALVHGCELGLQKLSISAKATDTAMVTQEDLQALSTFEHVRHLTLEGFDFGCMIMLPYLPKNLETLQLSISLQFKDLIDLVTAYRDFGVSIDIPGLESPDNRHEIWKTLPRLRRFKTIDSYRECTYDYTRVSDLVKLTAISNGNRSFKIVRFDVIDGMPELEETKPKRRMKPWFFIASYAVLLFALFVFFKWVYV